MKLAVVMPALNEEATICQVIRKIPEQIPEVSEIVVIVVSDGSSDQTDELARNEDAMVIRHMRTRGVGVAFQTGLTKALELGADIMVNMDADGQFEPADIPKLLRPILEGEAECVTASRFMDKSLHPSMSLVNHWGNHIMALLISLIIRRRCHDVACGFRAYNRNAMLNMNLVGDFTYTQETFINLAFKGIFFKEVPILVRGKREHGKSRVASNLFYYTYKSVLIIFRTFRDYKPLFVFGIIAGLSMAVGLALGVFVMLHYFDTGSFSPHIWACCTSGFLISLSIVSFFTGLVADMLDRIRLNQERTLHLLKSQFYNRDGH